MVEPTRRFRLPRRERLRSRRLILRLFAAGRVVTGETLLVRALPNGLPHSRILPVCSRKLGMAVVRNRAKRLIREAYRLNRHRWPSGLDIAVVPRPGVRLSLAGVSSAIEAALGRIARGGPGRGGR